ncbi:hypothetical protein AF91_15415 (plasmid) [Lacticaseibacillus paracasei N1115]|uniref:Uncharacterized protein n=1 Tax=Lacticaseibacillus paracasei N1115 TaxID=1446494 RepID=A0A806LDI1_LACPA|nr:hypothetical protein AF91_15415 [Lacticaseibacillus paracasei N1115]
MIRESKTLIENLDNKFLRKYHLRYHILVVDNLDCSQYVRQILREIKNRV